MKININNKKYNLKLLFGWLAMFPSAAMMRIISFLYVFFIKFSFVRKDQASLFDRIDPDCFRVEFRLSPLAFNMTQSPWIPNLFKVPLLFLSLLLIVTRSALVRWLASTSMAPWWPTPQLFLNKMALALRELVNLWAQSDSLISSVTHLLNLPQGDHEIAVKVIQSDPQIPTGIMYLRVVIFPRTV